MSHQTATSQHTPVQSRAIAGCDSSGEKHVIVSFVFLACREVTLYISVLSCIDCFYQVSARSTRASPQHSL